MNKYMTLDEEIQRMKEMHNKSIIIEYGQIDRTPIDGKELEKGQEIITSVKNEESSSRFLPQQFKTLETFQKTDIELLVRYMYDHSYKSCFSFFYELMKFFGIDEDHTPSNTPTNLDYYLPVSLRTQQTFTRKDIYNMLTILKEKSYKECASVIGYIMTEMNLWD